MVETPDQEMLWKALFQFATSYQQLRSHIQPHTAKVSERQGFHGRLLAWAQLGLFKSGGGGDIVLTLDRDHDKL